MRVAHAPRPLNLLVAKAGSCRASLFANPIAATSDRSPQAIVRVVATERSQLWVKPHCAERKTWATSGSHTLTGKPVPHDCYMESSPWSFPAQEASLSQTAAIDLPMLAVADLASRLVFEVIGRTPVPPSGAADGRDASNLQHRAIWFMAIIATRCVRTCMAVISVGYEEQVVGYTRLIAELVTASQKVVDDHSGEYASQWLKGRAATGSKLVDQEFYKRVSGPVHASVRGIMDWLAIPVGDGNHNVVVGPERRPEGANATLVFMAGAARDIAVQLAGHRGVGINVSQLDKEIRALIAHYDGLQPTQHQGGLTPSPEGRRRRANKPPSLAQHRL